uniref:RES domain-containing protein n=1 Tax=Rhabditophanes sp. KR3021 TaxID=114890 RepID=A0AC35TR85_9BILA
MYLQSENIKKLKIRESQKSWAYLYPNYHPPSYSKPKEAFPVDLQCFVDIATPSNVIEISKKLRYRLITDLFSGPYVTDYDKACFASNGIPLNPSGRCGISGRGLHPKFGINYRAFYCIFKKNPDNGTLYLLTTTHEIGMGLLPFADKYDTISRSDVFLVKLLTSLKVPVKNVQLMSSKSHLSIGQVESNTGHVMYKKMPDQIDTDNAWLEADVYCLNLSHHFSLLSDSHDNFHWTQLTAGTVNVVACNAVHSQFISASLNLLNIG